MAYLSPVALTSNKDPLVEGSVTHYVTNLNDNNVLTHWVPINMTAPCYATLDFGALKKVTQVEVRTNYSTYVNTVFDILTSTDNVAWVTAKAACTLSITGEGWNVYTFAEVTCRYLRILMVTPGNPSYYLLSDVRVTGVDAGPIYKAAGSYLSTAIDISNNPILTLTWDQTTPTGTAVVVKTATTATNTTPLDGEFITQQNGISITNDTSKQCLWIKVLLTTTDSMSTPTFSNLKILSGDDRYGIFTEDGKLVAPIDHTHPVEVATDVLLTGYTKAVAHGNVLDTDNVAMAMGKVDYDVGLLYPLVATTVPAEISNVFTLNLALGLNFVLTPSNTTGKTIALINVPSGLSFTQPVSIKLVCTSGNVISTYPANIVWLAGTPTYVVGKTYYITLIPNGTGWHGSVLGGF